MPHSLSNSCLLGPQIHSFCPCSASPSSPSVGSYSQYSLIHSFWPVLCTSLLSSPPIAPYHLSLTFPLVSFAPLSFPIPFTLFQWFPVFVFSSIIHILLHQSVSCLHSPIPAQLLAPCLSPAPRPLLKLSCSSFSAACYPFPTSLWFHQSLVKISCPRFLFSPQPQQKTSLIFVPLIQIGIQPQCFRSESC